MFDNNFTQVPHTRYQQQIQRHEVARMQQTISEMEWHLNGLHQRAAYLGQTMQTDQDRKEFTNLLMKLNQTTASLNMHYDDLSKMVNMANLNYGKNIPEQCRREVYHLYHAGRYNQSQLASHYGVSQSAVSKIVNGPAPAPIEGVNPQGIASS